MATSAVRSTPPLTPLLSPAPDHLPTRWPGNCKRAAGSSSPSARLAYQSLWKFVKENGELTAYNLGGVAFVPFTGPGIEQKPGASTPTP